VRGGLIVLLGEGVARASSIAGFLTIAGLLGPENYGLAAVALLAVTAVESVAALGLGHALQASADRERAAKAALALALLVGGAGTLALFVLADPIATVLGETEATPLVRAVAPLILLTRWNDVRRATLEAELRFGRTAVAGASGALLGTAAGIGAAALGAGPLSLVILPLSRETFRSAVLLFGGGPLRPAFDRPAMRSLWQVSKQLLAGSVVIFLYTNLDDAVTSRYLGSAALGIYVFAYQISNFPVYFITHTLDRVLLPTWMRLRDDATRWGAGYVQSLRLLAWITGTIQITVAFHGPRALDLLYGDQWDDAAGALIVLAFYGLFRAVGATCGSVFLSAGKAHLVRRIAEVQLAVMVPLLILAVSRGTVAHVAASVTLPLAGATIVALKLAADVVGVPAVQMLGGVTEAWFIAVVGGVVGTVLASPIETPWLALCLGVAASGMVAVSYGLVRLRPELTTLVSSVARTHRPDPSRT